MCYKLHEHIAAGDNEKVKELLAVDVDVGQQDKSGNFALGIAVDSGNIEIVRLLLEAGADPNLGSWTSPLEAAVTLGNTEIARLLIEAGSDVNLILEDGTTALISAAGMGHMNIVKLLVEQGANCNILRENRVTALSISATNNHQEVFAYLLPRTDKLIRDSSVSAALSLAAAEGNIETIRLIAKYRARLNLVNPRDKTPLMIAADSRQVESLRELLQLDFNVNNTDIKGFTALMFASRFKSPRELRIKEREILLIQMMHLLIENHADLDISDVKGRTALMLSASSGNVAGVEILIHSGANTKMKDMEGKTAIVYIEEALTFMQIDEVYYPRYSKIIQILKECQ